MNGFVAAHGDPEIQQLQPMLERIWRSKQEFSQGSGSADPLIPYFETRISDGELVGARAEFLQIGSEEELYYLNIFTDHFGKGGAVDTVGQWISL